MILDLLRHGEPKGGRLYRGNQDDPLTQKGWGQMLDSTKGKQWDFIASSPLVRCFAFAKHLSDTSNTPYKTFKDLEELGFGDWQGKSSKEIGQDKVARFKSDPTNNRPHNAENLYVFQRRVLSTFKMIMDSKNDRQSVLIIAHAGVIRTIKSHLLNFPIEKMFTMEVVSGSCERFEL
ncbi:MAG TPA: histidine phosphatase family protein [Candidatus Thioglobus sp.]|jgi:Fructose-2,6-bisphosphatase|nr:histidine phosphatase family protein [Candidatus Thioglobus sp.]